MEMSDAILVYQLLINANIPEERQRLARVTMGKLTYVTMKKQLRAIHDCCSNYSVSHEDAKVKTEASCSDDKKVN